MSERPKDFIDRRLEHDGRIGDYINETNALMSAVRRILKINGVHREQGQSLDDYYAKLTPAMLKEVQKNPMKTFSERFNLSGKAVTEYPVDMQDQQVVDEVDQLVGILNTTQDPNEFNAARLKMVNIIDTRRAAYFENNPE